MGDPSIVIYSVIFALVWQAIGYYMVMYMSSMAAIPEDLYEAASLDGATEIQIFFQVTLPLIWSNIRTTLTFYIISTINLSFLFCSDHDRRRPERKDRSFPELYVQAGIWSRCIRIRYGDRSCCIPLLVHTGSSCKQDYRQRSLRILERSEVEICMRKNTEFLHMYFTRFFIYVALIALAISIIVPVAWVFMASLKKNAEFIGADVNPWALPKQFYYQNFVVAFQDARMGDFFLNSFIVTALALALLLILALPASYVLARFKFRGKKFFNGAFMAGLFINVNYIVVPIF